MFRTRTQKLSERGDTIVEVLIAIAVVSMVLGGAYATTNKSLQATRSAQEQGVALKLVETQLEQLKAMADTAGALTGAPVSFCILQTGGKPTITSTAAAGSPCSLNGQGVTAASTDQPVYQLAITQPTPHNFQITNNWHDVSGKHSDLVQMNYRIYPQ
ncbi:MAG TPA: prepilin-type N-terminal cleavage/methylation domain-containing protein [Candidatus Saccharimonadales bacterium]|nr:prepilin-type N-terminal cleavage/methylation domain-containing protein [Candidatus Saccharimonadales bacterium]